MATNQQWRVSFGDNSAIVEADNWLGALAQALTQVGLDLGAMGRLVCTTLPDGSATAREPRSGGEVRVVPLDSVAPPGFEMPESSFARINIPHLIVPTAAPVVVSSANDSVIAAPAALRAQLEADEPTESKLVLPPSFGPPSGLDDRLEDLFMRLGEVSEAGSANEACAAALRIASELVVADAGAVLIKTSRGDALRFRAALGPAAKTVLDTTIPLDRGIAGFVFQLGVALSIGDAKRDERHYSRVDKQTGYVTRAVLAAPVRADQGGVYGVLELINPPRPFNDDDLELATRVAATLGGYFRAMDQ